jgi:serine/threonine protein kinase
VFIILGTFGEVRLAIQKKTQMRVAIKLIDRNKILSEDKYNYLNIYMCMYIVSVCSVYVMSLKS